MIKIFLLSGIIDFIVNGIVSNLWIVVFIKEGMTLEHAAITAAFMRLSTSLFELPTGFLADKYLGRKGASITGLLFLISSMLVLGLTNSDFISKIAMIVSGLGITFISGAKQSWFRDIVSKNYPLNLNKLFFDLDICGRFATITGVWSGAYFISLSRPDIVWLLAASMAFAAFILALTLPSSSIEYHQSHFQNSKFCSFGWMSFIVAPSILICLFASMVYSIEDGIRDIIFQPAVLALTGGNSMFLAYQSTSTLLPRIFGSMFYKKFLLGRNNQFAFLAVSLLFIGLIEIYISNTQNYLIFASMWAIAVFLFGIFFPLKETLINKIIDRLNGHKWRATILSVDSMLSNLVQGIVCLLIASRVTEINALSFFKYGGYSLILCFFVYLSFILVKLPSFTK